MSRPVSLIKITFQLHRPWAVGGVAFDTDEVDLPVLLDFNDDPYVPASSLVGALRQHLHSTGLEDPLWLGPPIGEAGRPTTGEGGESAPRLASPLRALGTRLVGTHQLATRATTRINARSRAADGGSLRSEHRVDVVEDNAVDAGPARLEWYASIDRGVSDPLVTGLIDVLPSWQPIIGRGRSKGMGQARVASIEVVGLDLAVPTDLTWWLTWRKAWFEGTGAPPRPVTATPGHDLRSVPASHAMAFAWRVVDPLAIGTGEFSPRKPGTKRLNDTVRRTGAARSVRFDSATKQPVIPATAWKGIFRHRVEFILTTIGCKDAEVKHHIVRLFGEASKTSSGEQTGRRGSLIFIDSPLGCSNGPAQVWERSHVGIDRFTGGVQSGKLFTVEVVAPGALANQSIESTTAIEDRDRRLLLLAAKDIHDGLVGLGGMVTRGYGTLQLTTNCVAAQSFAGVTAAEFAVVAVTEESKVDA